MLAYPEHMSQLMRSTQEHAMPLSNGLLLASLRAVDQQRSRILKGEMIQPYHYLTQEKARLLSPGEIVKMQIEIFPTSAVIRKGNKLRVAISPSNQAQGILNCPRQERAAGGITTIHNSPQYPFSVVLPIVPMAALNYSSAGVRPVCVIFCLFFLLLQLI
ncbi:MAG: CocE/NonD family hydrolase C-terminal non-catalytic domain-containing protein [Ketobacter sp.]